MATGTSFRISPPLLLLLLLILLHLSSIPPLTGSDLPGRRDLLGYTPRKAGGGGARAGEAAPDCRAMRSRGECRRSSRWCRWCRSDALDDMCFGSSEAWRLPNQVFSCDPITTSS